MRSIIRIEGVRHVNQLLTGGLPVILPRPRTGRASAASLAEGVGGALVENKTFQDQPIFAVLSEMHANAVCF
jgi:hypothetical protein